MKVLVEAYGCTMNRGEAEEFADAFQARGHALAAAAAGAEAFAIFTCGVIDTTERRMLRRISELAAAGKPLLVCGCLPNISPKKIQKIAPHAILLGPGRHMEGLAALGCGKSTSPGHLRTVGILPIASGCTGSCAYCITMKARGRLASREPEALRARLRELVDKGAVEIQLCAQDTAVYGRDIGSDLAGLVKELSSTQGDFMIRIGMMNPASVLRAKEGVMDAFSNPKAFKFLHLPVQSGSDRILESMGRGHTVAEFEELVSEFRSQFPCMAVSTDIITGFPGETDSDFAMSREMIERIRPDIVNITRFSSRPGTAAHVMKGKVPSRISKDRSRILTELRFRLTAENYSVLEGRTARALATERRVPGTTFLRTPEYKPVVVDSELALGKWYDLRIAGKEKTHLCGKILKNGN